MAHSLEHDLVRLELTTAELLAEADSACHQSATETPSARDTGAHSAQGGSKLPDPGAEGSGSRSAAGGGGWQSPSSASDDAVSRDDFDRSEQDPSVRLQAAITASHTNLRKLSGLLQDLEDQAKLETVPSARMTAQDQVRRHRAELARLQHLARQAAVRYKTIMQRQHQADRQALLSQTDQAPFAAGSRRAITPASLLHQSGKVTESLQRTRNLMAMELDRMASVNDVLSQSSDKLIATHDQHVRFEGDAHQSKRHLTKYRQRQLTDKLVIGAGAVFFLSVVFYIWYRRFAWLWYGRSPASSAEEQEL